jgi:hypothetical protein
MERQGLLGSPSTSVSGTGGLSPCCGPANNLVRPGREGAILAVLSSLPAPDSPLTDQMRQLGGGTQLLMARDSMG